MKNALLSFALVVVSLSVAVLLGEASLRLLGYAGAPESLIGNIRPVNDPILNWRFIPNSKVQDGKTTYHYNNAGFRDEDHRPDKRTGVIRILVVGDSVTEGNGVEWKSVFAHRLQDMLGDRYEVINFGMSGLNTPQEIHLLKVEGQQYQPDVVIVNFVFNDCDFFSEFHAVQQFQNEKDTKIGLLGDISINPRIKRSLKSSALIYFVKGRMEHLIALMLGREEHNYYLRLWNSPDCHRRVSQAFDQLKNLQEKSSFEVRLIVWPLLVDYERYEFKHVHERVTQEALRRGFKILDLFESFSAASYRDLQVTAEDNIHPNQEGHRIAAEAFLEWYRKM